MCTGAIVIRGGRAVSSVRTRGALASALGTYPNKIPNRCETTHATHQKPNNCLCWVDFDALSKQVGLSVEWSADDDAWLLEDEHSRAEREGGA